ncbi:hypothetical protein LI328DRAFT_135312 [Trichoderma asperelloides]|nr:hypothetical protein LI328DRAFT_135312 [Trichoderma asperelloides]
MYESCSVDVAFWMSIIAEYTASFSCVSSQGTTSLILLRTGSCTHKHVRVCICIHALIHIACMYGVHDRRRF